MLRFIQNTIRFDMTKTNLCGHFGHDSVCLKSMHCTVLNYNIWSSPYVMKIRNLTFAVLKKDQQDFNFHL